MKNGTLLYPQAHIKIISDNYNCCDRGEVGGKGEEFQFYIIVFSFFSPEKYNLILG